MEDEKKPKKKSPLDDYESEMKKDMFGQVVKKKVGNTPKKQEAQQKKKTPSNSSPLDTYENKMLQDKASTVVKTPDINISIGQGYCSNESILNAYESEMLNQQASNILEANRSGRKKPKKKKAPSEEWKVVIYEAGLRYIRALKEHSYTDDKIIKLITSENNISKVFNKCSIHFSEKRGRRTMGIFLLVFYGFYNSDNFEDVLSKLKEFSDLSYNKLSEFVTKLIDDFYEVTGQDLYLIWEEKAKKQELGELKNQELKHSLMAENKKSGKEFGLPEEKAIIEREELKKVVAEIIETYDDQEYTIKTLSTHIGANLSNAYSKGGSIPLNALRKLEYLANRKIPHTIVLGNKSTKRIILEKSKELAELIGFILVSGNISVYDSKNSRSKGYSLYIHFRKRNRSKKLINHIRSLVMKLFKIDEAKLNVKRNENDEIVAFNITSLPIFYELFINGVKPNNNVLPNWIFERGEYIIHCLKGMFNGHGDFDMTLPEYKDSVYGNFSLIFEKASPSSVEIAQNYKQLCDKLEIKTTKIYKRESSRNDSTIRVIVRINKKDSYIRFLSVVNPLLWHIKKEDVYKFFLKAGISPDTIFSYNEDYLLQQEYNYNKELAKILLSLFEEYGNYDDVTKVFNETIAEGSKRPLGKDRIISYIKKLFREKDYIKCYGSKGYDIWYSNNSRIIIGDDLESTTIPNYLIIQIYREIYQVLSNNLFDISDSEVIKSVIDYFKKKKMAKFSKTSEPNLLEYGRFSRLLKSHYRDKLFIPYFNYILKFIREINSRTENNRRIGYTELAKRYIVLFYHHQQVKEIIEDLKAEFSKEFKVGFDQEYRWHRLRFKYHPNNLMKITKSALYKKLAKLFDMIAKMDYDVDIFRFENPRCSDFLITGSRSKPIQSETFLPYIKELHDKKIIKKNSDTVLGTRLINYTNLAERYYKSKYPQKSYSSFLSDEGNIYHDQLQNFVFQRDSDIIATELLVWLKINFPLLNIDYLSGHIDFLFYFNNCLYVCDYKPEHRDRIFLKSIPQISTYGLLLEDMLNLSNLHIKCITFNKINAWEYEPSILYMHVKDIVSDLKSDYPIDAKWETYLSQYFKFS